VWADSVVPQVNPGLWARIWTVHYIGPTTVNCVDDTLNPHAVFLMVPLYLLFAIIFLVLFISWRRWNILAAAKAFVISSVISALFFALVTDYRWFKQWEADRQSLAGLSIDERIAFLNREWNGEFELARGLRRLLPPGETVRVYAGKPFQENKLGYYLLPVKLSTKGVYTLVYRDDSVFYDPATETLKKENEVVGTTMALVARTGNGAYLLKDMGKGGTKTP
jgi:hypothetical protein